MKPHGTVRTLYFGYSYMAELDATHL